VPDILPDTIHASAALFAGQGVLILGASGSGKSSLLLALLAAGGTLVADDRVITAVVDCRLVASPPDSLAGLMEVRGVGIVRRPFVASVAIDLAVELRAAAECPRLPDGDDARIVIAGIALPRVFVASGAPDGAARVAAALARGGLTR
jgi:serine kinase of HPr protein (carbohydrate metabolism regulator)